MRVFAWHLTLFWALFLALPSAADVQERADLQALFERHQTRGTLIVHDLKRDQSWVYNPVRAQTSYSPSSTFKIFNSLIAIDTGVVRKLETDSLPWDGKVFTVNGKPLLPEACNAAVTLRTAFANSCIPAYQVIARQVGEERYQRYFAIAHYGNQNQGNVLDHFWLNGDLQLTAWQQIYFLRRVLNKQLPLSANAYAALPQLMQVSSRAGFSLYGKTGYAFAHDPVIGWWVGWLERGEDRFLFALNIDMSKPEHSQARKDIVEAAWPMLGIL